MRQVIAVIVLVIVTASAASAEPRKWYKSGKWWAGEAVIVGALVADGQSTCRMFKYGYYEANWILHGSRSCGQAVGLLVGVGALDTTFHWAGYRLMRNDPSPLWRASQYFVVPAIVAVGHGGAAIHNYRLPGQR